MPLDSPKNEPLGGTPPERIHGLLATPRAVALQEVDLPPICSLAEKKRSGPPNRHAAHLYHVYRDVCTPGERLAMEKWADFVVTGVRYNATRSRIDAVEIRTDTGESIAGDPRLVRRQDVVSALTRGTTFVTSYLADGKWKKGEDVRAVPMRHERFLRTDNNAIEADNLGNLPEFG